jgi:hypothetical protein
MPVILFLLLSLSLATRANEQPTGFTQADRDRLIRIEAVLEQHEKRLEAMDRNSSELRADMRNIILLFGGLVTAIIGFAVWDRRTMIRPFEDRVRTMDAAIAEAAEERKATRLIAALRDFAKTDARLADLLRTHGLL